MVNYSFSLVTFEYFILIMIRITCFVSVAPFFSTTNTPVRVRAGLSFFISLILYQVLPKESLTYTGLIGYAVIVIKEGITGLLIGYAASICNSILLLVGNMLDMHLGLSMATEYNPDMKAQSSVSSTFYNYLVVLLLLVSNFHQYLVRAITDSFQLIPVNGQVFQLDHMLTSMTEFMTDSFVIAFRITLPVFACIMILNAILGIMAKVSPQMNMFSVGMQLKLLVGFVILFLTISLSTSVSSFIFEEMKKMIVSMIRGMYGG